MKQPNPAGDHIVIDKLFKNSATNPTTIKLITAAGKSLKKGFKLQQLANASLMVNEGRRIGKKNNAEYNDIKDFRSPEAENPLQIGGGDLPPGM